MSDRRERKATPSGVFDWTQSGQSGAWGDPNGRIGKSEKDIPIHCSPPLLSEISDFVGNQKSIFIGNNL
jgi:hypothetical protein